MRGLPEILGVRFWWNKASSVESRLWVIDGQMDRRHLSGIWRSEGRRGLHPLCGSPDVLQRTDGSRVCGPSAFRRLSFVVRRALNILLLWMGSGEGDLLPEGSKTNSFRILFAACQGLQAKKPRFSSVRVRAGEEWAANPKDRRDRPRRGWRGKPESRRDGERRQVWAKWSMWTIWTVSTKWT